MDKRRVFHWLNYVAGLIVAGISSFAVNNGNYGLATYCGLVTIWFFMRGNSYEP